MDFDAEQDSENEKHLSSTHKQSVDATIHRLQDLAYETVVKSGVDLSHLEDFQSLTQQLSDLAAECHDLHDLLEIETIASSKKRHVLQLLPQRYSKEMEESVLAARFANEDEMKSLQKQLHVAQEASTRLNSQHEDLMKENSKLQPECNRIREEHDEIIAQLNQRMSDKANKQIGLNETRDSLRDVNQTLSDLSVAHEILAEDLEEEKKAAAVEKQKLKDEVETTELAINEQKNRNITEKRETDKLLEKIMDMGAKVDEKQKIVRRLESSLARLEIQTYQLQDKIERERRANQELSRQNETLQASNTKQHMEYDEKVEELGKKLQKVLGQIAEAETENIALSDQKDAAIRQRDQTMRLKSQRQSKAKEISINVENLKNNTTKLVATAAAYNESVETLRNQLTALEENHEATMNTYNTQIGEYKDTLSQEQQERGKVQDLRDESEKVLETFRAGELKFMNDMAHSIEQANKQQREMLDKSAWLRRETEMELKKTRTMEVRLEVNQSSFRTMKETLHMDIERLENSVHLLTTENVRKAEYVEDKKPVLEEMTVEVEEKGKDYNVIKDEVVNVRNKEKSSSDKLSRIKLQLEKLERPTLGLKASLKEKQQEVVLQLEVQAEERKQIEADIYSATMKLEQVNKENTRFEEDSDAIQEDVDILTADMLSHATHQRVLHRELASLRKRFSEEWKVCIEMEQESADQDQTVLESIHTLQYDTRERADSLMNIGTYLQSELENLTAFVENVASRRPRDTRQSKRRVSNNVNRSSNAKLTDKESKRGDRTVNVQNMLEQSPASDRSLKSLGRVRRLSGRRESARSSFQDSRTTLPTVASS